MTTAKHPVQARDHSGAAHNAAQNNLQGSPQKSLRHTAWQATSQALRQGLAAAACLGLAACAIGPDYHKPALAVPASFKEGADWQRAAANPQGALSSQWWLAFHDASLTQLEAEALKANQSIVAAEAAYRVAQAEVESSRASLFPIVTADASGTRGRSTVNGTGGSLGNTTNGTAGVRNSISVTAAASWEPDLWGQIRREIEASKQTAQATDAQLAGERLSITASVASDYLELRQLDIDIDLLTQQQKVDARILEMTRASYQQGTASNDALLIAQDELEAVVANLQTSKISREQFEHALAVLVGVPPASFTLAAQPDYTFALPGVPLALPSVLLERRPDVVAAERTAAAANARIGVAEAAFFPILDLSAQGGFEHNTLAHLFSLPNRIWTLGPDLAATIFDGGARTAAVKQARATYDEQVANYRQAVLSAFQNVEDSLSSVNHLQDQAAAFQQIYTRNQQLFASQQAQLRAGTVSDQNVLTQQLLLLSAEQNLKDTQSQQAQGRVALIKNLGGGWQQPGAGAAPGAVAKK